MIIHWPELRIVFQESISIIALNSSSAFKVTLLLALYIFNLIIIQTEYFMKIIRLFEHVPTSPLVGSR